MNDNIKRLFAYAVAIAIEKDYIDAEMIMQSLEWQDSEDIEGAWKEFLKNFENLFGISIEEAILYHFI